MSLARPKSLRARHQLSTPELKVVILFVTLKKHFKAQYFSRNTRTSADIYLCVCFHTCGVSYDFSTWIHCRMQRINRRIPKLFLCLSCGVHKQRCLWEGGETSLSILCDLIPMRTSAFQLPGSLHPDPLLTSCRAIYIKIHVYWITCFWNMSWSH